MPAVIGSIEVTLKLLGADRFQQDARTAGSSVEQAARRITTSTDQAAAATTRLKQGVSSLAVQNSAFRSLGFAALRANTSVGTLTQGVYLLTAALGGLGAAFAARAFTNFADTYTNITNRLNATLSTQQARVQAEQDVYDIAQRSRASLDATSRLYSRLTQSARELGVTQKEIAQATETSLKALTTGGATTQEAASVATQLAQALGSGRLAGDELRSIAENSPVLIDAIAREFKVAVGGLKELGAEGELTSKRVLKAILSAQGEVEAAFQRTNPTIANGIQQIDNALTRYIGTADKAWGASNALARGLGFVADNMESIGDAVKYAAVALGGSFLLRRAGSSSQEGTIIGNFSKQLQDDRARLQAEVDNAKFDIAKANADLTQARQRQAAGGFAAAFGGGGGDQDLLNERKAAMNEAERAQERYRKAREAYAQGEQRLGQITATLGPQFVKALEAEERARSKLADTVKKLDAARTASDLAVRVADAPGATRAEQGRVDVAERRVRELTNQLRQQAADAESKSSRVSGMADASQETARQQRIAVIRDQGLRDEQRTEAFRQTVAAADRVRAADAVLMASQRAAGARTVAEAEAMVANTLVGTTAAMDRLKVAQDGVSKSLGTLGAARAAGTAAFAGMTAAAAGLQAFLGGPLGVALAAAGAAMIAYEVIQNKAAAETERHTEAAKKLAGALKSLQEANAAGSGSSPKRITDLRLQDLEFAKAARFQRDQVVEGFAEAGKLGGQGSAAARLGIDLGKAMANLSRMVPTSKEAQAAAADLNSVLDEQIRVSTDLTKVKVYVELQKDIAAYRETAEAARLYGEARRKADDLQGSGAGRKSVYEDPTAGQIDKMVGTPDPAVDQNFKAIRDGIDSLNSAAENFNKGFLDNVPEASEEVIAAVLGASTQFKQLSQEAIKFADNLMTGVPAAHDAFMAAMQAEEDKLHAVSKAAREYAEALMAGTEPAADQFVAQSQEIISALELAGQRFANQWPEDVREGAQKSLQAAGEATQMLEDALNNAGQRFDQGFDAPVPDALVQIRSELDKTVHALEYAGSVFANQWPEDVRDGLDKALAVAQAGLSELSRENISSAMAAVDFTELDDALRKTGSSFDLVKKQMADTTDPAKSAEAATNALATAIAFLSQVRPDLSAPIAELMRFVSAANMARAAAAAVAAPGADRAGEMDAMSRRRAQEIKDDAGLVGARSDALSKLRQESLEAAARGSLKKPGDKEAAKTLIRREFNYGLTDQEVEQLYNDRAAARARSGGGGRAPKKSDEAKDAEKLAEAMAELRQDAAVASLSELDQQTVRFAQSSGVATKNIEQFIAAMKSGDMSAIPAEMQAIRTEIEKLEAVKFAQGELDKLFPAKEMAEKLNQLAIAARESPQIAANLKALQMQVSLEFVADEIKDFSGAVSEFAQSAIKDMDNIGDAVENLVDRLLDSALSAAFKPAEDALNGFLGGLFKGAGTLGGGGLAASPAATIGSSPGAISSLYHRGGVVGRGAPDRRSIDPRSFIGAPVLHKGLSGREFPAILEYGERVLTRRMEERNVATMSGLASVASTSPRPNKAGIANININLEGAAGNQEVARISEEAARKGIARYDRAILSRIDEKKGRA